MHNGNKTRAAETLGVSYKTLLTKIKEYEMLTAKEEEEQGDD